MLERSYAGINSDDILEEGALFVLSVENVTIIVTSGKAKKDNHQANKFGRKSVKA